MAGSALGRGPSAVTHVVYDVVVYDDVVMHHVVVRVPAGRECQKCRHQNRCRGRQAEPLNHRVFSPIFPVFRHFSACIQNSG